MTRAETLPLGICMCNASTLLNSYMEGMLIQWSVEKFVCFLKQKAKGEIATL